MCWWRWGLGWCLHIGEGGGIAVTGRSPHRGLQHVHGVIPLAAGTGDCIKWCSRAGQRAGQWGRVLPRCFGWPRFGFVILGNRREFLVSFLVSYHCDLPTQLPASHSLAQGKLLCQHSVPTIHIIVANGGTELVCLHTDTYRPPTTRASTARPYIYLADLNRCAKRLSH